MKSKELKAHNLPFNRIIERSLDAKPYVLIFLIFGIGVYISIKSQIFYGAIIASVAVASFFLLPKRVLIEFSREYCVLYNKANTHDCTIVYYEDVVFWNYISGFIYDELKIELTDGTVETIEGFSKTVFELYLYRYMRDKKYKK